MTSIRFNDLSTRLAGDLHTDMGHRQMLATDASIFRVLPAAVVYPRNTADVVETVRFAGAHGLTVHARGAGSGLCGAALGCGIIVDFTRYMNRLIRLDVKNRCFECEPGYRFGELAADLEGAGLFFPPDPSSGEYATFGGMFATNASGAHSVKYGNVSDYVEDAEIVLAGGETTIRLEDIRKTPPNRLSPSLRGLFDMATENESLIASAYPEVGNNVCGYNLRGMATENRLMLHGMLCGAEGTLGIATLLTFRLLEKPPHESLVVAYFDDIISSATAVQKILPMKPAGIEIMDKTLLKLAVENDPSLNNKIPEDIDNALLIEFDAFGAEGCNSAAVAAEKLLLEGKFTHRAYKAVSTGEKKKFWAIRLAAVPILYRLKGRKKNLALVEDATVPISALVDYFQGINDIFDRIGVDHVLYGHIAKGLLHSRPLLDLKDPRDVDLLRPIADRVFELVRRLGGAVSGEHGDGRLRSPYIRQQYPKIYPLFGRVKKLLDPEGIFNPEIITRHDPEQMKKYLRFGPAYNAGLSRRPMLNWPEGLMTEIEKCHGCSKCTTVTTATRMCPVYKFTRQENAAPKAKANILRAVISGAIPEESMVDVMVQSVMDLCVNCGSCAVECPSHVNIPKMAMEAKARKVASKGAKPGHVVTAHVETAARLSWPYFKFIEPLASGPAMRRVTERFIGLSGRRKFVSFSRKPLFRRVPPRTGTGKREVIYFSGCYAGYIRPEIGVAAVGALNAAGFTVHLPAQHCCGLPLLSKGMAASARNRIRANLHKWRGLLRRADRIVVTCTSCQLALTHEWRYLLSEKEFAKVRRKVMHISRLLIEHRERLQFSPVSSEMVYHQPCHMRAMPDSESSLELLSQIPELKVQKLDSHCCGMAGSWGMLAANHALSRRIGDDLMVRCRARLPEGALTDCPTCRMQMEDLGDLPVLHPIEVIVRSLRLK